MSSDFNQLLKEIRQTNLCTWYLLPLTGLTKFSFGEGLFLNSYLEPKLRWIIVQVPDLNLVAMKLKIKAQRLWSNDRGGFLAYQLMAIHEAPYGTLQQDIDCYLGGTYSKFSEYLKEIIFERSGLPYRQPNGNGGFITDIRLMALEGREELKQYLREQLDVRDLPDELLLPPSAESFMDVTEV
jgi:hypothetical protein